MFDQLTIPLNVIYSITCKGERPNLLPVCSVDRGNGTMKVDKEFVLREIAGDYIIIPTGKTVLEFNGLITVNEVGVSLWNMLQNEVTLEELVQGILDEYDVEEEVAREDIQEFLDTLVAGGILTKDREDTDEEAV